MMDGIQLIQLLNYFQIIIKPTLSISVFFQMSFWQNRPFSGMVPELKRGQPGKIIFILT